MRHIRLLPSTMAVCWGSSCQSHPAPIAYTTNSSLLRRSERNNNDNATKQQQHLRTELCKGYCNGEDCKIYPTPLNKCFNGALRFPNDPSWADDLYLLDLIVESIDNVDTLWRRFFPTISACNATTTSTNESTSHNKPTDEMILPLNECIGPFGRPRPWGKFSVVVVDASLSSASVDEKS
jgi:hypothetical protein